MQRLNVDRVCLRPVSLALQVDLGFRALPGNHQLIILGSHFVRFWRPRGISARGLRVSADLRSPGSRPFRVDVVHRRKPRFGVRNLRTLRMDLRLRHRPAVRRPETLGVRASYLFEFFMSTLRNS